MNSDSLFDSDFFQENKEILTILTTVSLAFFTIYWLFRGLKPEENLQTQANFNRNLINLPNESYNNNLDQNNLTNIQYNISSVPFVNNKRRLLINASSLLIDDVENIDVGKIYQFLFPLSEIFDLYMVIMIKDNIQVEKVYEKLEVLTSDSIVYKHRILFASKFEGICAMIRSIDPFAHIEGDPDIISNLFRFINEFWYLRSDKFSASVEEVIKNDSNNSNININLKLKKFGAVEDILTYVEKYKNFANK